MGIDDRNEGTGEGECLEHVWKLTGVSLVPGEGSYEGELCARLRRVPAGGAGRADAVTRQLAPHR